MPAIKSIGRNRTKADIKQIVKDELTRIAADDKLKHLLQK